MQGLNDTSEGLPLLLLQRFRSCKVWIRPYPPHRLRPPCRAGSSAGCWRTLSGSRYSSAESWSARCYTFDPWFNIDSRTTSRGQSYKQIWALSYCTSFLKFTVNLPYLQSGSKSPKWFNYQYKISKKLTKSLWSIRLPQYGQSDFTVNPVSTL